jgi:hypothetical protein
MWTAYLYFAQSTGVALAWLCHRSVTILPIAARCAMVMTRFFLQFAVEYSELTKYRTAEEGAEH